MQGTYGQRNSSLYAVLGLMVSVVLSLKVAYAVPGNALEGQAIYQRLCVGCHGMDGRGGPMGAMLKIVPRDLTDPAYMDARSDEQLFTAIRYGGEAVERSSTMPAFSGQLSEEEIWDTVTYVRTLVGTTTTGQDVATNTSEELVMARLRVLVWPEYDDPRVLIIMRGEMSPRQAFPTTIKVPIPKNAEIIGAGMISETNALLLHPHEMIPGDKEDFLTLNLPVPRFFVELYYAPFRVEQADKHFTHRIAGLYPIQLLEVDIQQPTQATEFVTEPQPMEQATDRKGFMHSQFVYHDLAAGEARQFTVTYTRTTTETSVPKQPSAANAPEAVSRSPLSRPEVAVALLVVIALLFAGFAWIWSRRQASQDSVEAVSEAVPAAPAPLLSVDTTQPGQPNFCSQCGHTISPEHRFCARCGHALHP